MNKKLLLIFWLTFSCFMILTVGNSVKAAEEPAYTTISGGIECFFANGTPITIDSRGDGVEGAIITWDGGSQEVTANVRVFGGGHYDDTIHESSNVTMIGGTIRSIFGGGLHGSTVNTTNVNVSGGTITSGITGGGASVLANSTCHSATTTIVTTANVSVSGNANVETVFGGGEGNLSDTRNANTVVSGGTINYLTAGGSNGNTENATLVVSGGKVNVMQSVNRGTMNSADMEVNGGEVVSLYLGGEEGDSNVTGTIEAISLDIADDATVSNLYIGTSGGVKIGTEGSDDVEIELAIYDGANVQIANAEDFEDINIIEYVYVTVNDIVYTLEKGKTLEYLSETLEKVKNVEGKDFVKFVIKGTDEEFAEDTPITEDVILEAVYTEKQLDNTPPTGLDERNTGIIISMVVLFIVLNIGIFKKIK